MEEFITAEAIIVLLVLVATLVAIVARRSRLPYTVSLVLVGLAIAFRRPLEVEATPELIMAIFVPPLLFEAAFHLDFRLLRENLSAILMLAVPGVLITMLLVGGITAFGTGLPFATAAVFGALIAATDPVAVVSLFRALGVSRELALTVEGESLFNDGTAIVIFNIALAAALTGEFHLMDGVVDFMLVSLGGIIIGLALGWLSAQVFTRIDDRLIETALTTLLAYGAYVIAEHYHVSGVLAVVVAGLICGNLGMSDASPTTKIMILNLWEFLAFLANSMVFLLIGLSVDLDELWRNRTVIVVAVGAVLISRALVVYGFALLDRLRGKRAVLPFKYRHVLFWGGLRGAISLALALSLPVGLPNRSMLQAMTFGVVLFTLMAQGTTIQFLLEKLGFTHRPSHWVERETKLGQLFAAQAGLRRLEMLHREGLLTDEMWAGLRHSYREDRRQITRAMSRLFYDHAELEGEMLLRARREALNAERSALGDALRRGLLSSQVYEELEQEIDHRLEGIEMIQGAAHERQARQEEV